MDMFHKAGSAILSRSFTVLTERDTEKTVSAGQQADVSSDTNSEDVDIGEDASTVALVPWADILNAKYGCNKYVAAETVSFSLSSLLRHETIIMSGKNLVPVYFTRTPNT